MMKTAVLLIWAGAQLAAQEEFVPMKKGRKWVYKQGDSEFVQTVAGTEKVGSVECFVLQSEVSGQKESMWIAVNAEGSWLHKIRSGEVVSELPKPAQLLKYPMNKGDRWDARVPSGDLVIEYQFENAGQEEVEVAAGKYQAWTIKMKGMASGQEFSGTYWYAKGVGLVRQKISSKRGEFLIELKEVKE